MKDAFSNPTEAAEILHKYHKEISVEVAKGETELVKELAEVPGKPLGAIDPKRIQSTIDVMKESYPMKTTVDPKDMFAPGFIE